MTARFKFIKLCQKNTRHDNNCSRPDRSQQLSLQSRRKTSFTALLPYTSGWSAAWCTVASLMEMERICQKTTVQYGRDGEKTWTSHQVYSGAQTSLVMQGQISASHQHYYLTHSSFEPLAGAPGSVQLFEPIQNAFECTFTNRWK